MQLRVHGGTSFEVLSFSWPGGSLAERQGCLPLPKTAQTRALFNPRARWKTGRGGRQWASRQVLQRLTAVSKPRETTEPQLTAQRYSGSVKNGAPDARCR